ncbi:MAG: hypothetical protein ACYC0J_06895 [Gammaproteobacteria bacterium]
MKKAFVLCSILLFSTSVFAAAPMREGSWTLNQQQPIDFIEMDLFDQQILSVSVAPNLPDGKPASAISMHCHGKDFNISPGEKAICVVNWSYEVVTLSMQQGDITAKSAGTYQLTYIS